MDNNFGTCVNINVLLNSNFSGLSIATAFAFIPLSANRLDGERNQESYVRHKRCNKHGVNELGSNYQVPIICEIRVITHHTFGQPLEDSEVAVCDQKHNSRVDILRHKNHSDDLPSHLTLLIKPDSFDYGNYDDPQDKVNYWNQERYWSGGELCDGRILEIWVAYVILIEQLIDFFLRLFLIHIVDCSQHFAVTLINSDALEILSWWEITFCE